MAWLGKIVGGVVGGALGGPFGAAIGIAIGAGIDGQQEGESSGPPPMAAEAKGFPDELGELCEIKLSAALPAGSFGRFSVRTSSGKYLKGVEGFADSDGDFCRVAAIRNGRCVCYIPYSAVLPSDASECLLYVDIATLENGAMRCLGWVSFQQDLPKNGAWNRCTYFEPAFQLMMLVAMADGDLRPSALKEIRAICAREFEIAEKDADKLRESLKRARRAVEGVTEAAAPAVVRAFILRFPEVDVDALCNVLLAVVRADGPPSSRAIEALRAVACGVGLDEADWDKFALDEKLNISGHYATLGLKPGASAEVIRRAYRSLISQYHPDHFANAPASVVAMAQRKSVELREAYEALRGVA